jgi:TolB-like protein
LGGVVYSQQSTLPGAIQEAVKKVDSEIEKGQKVAIMNFISESPNLSDHIISEITNIIINEKRLLVVERSRIDAILAERGIQLSGEVSDAQLALIGNFDGVQYVITGSLNFVGSLYRFNLYVIDMNRGVRMASSIIPIMQNDAEIAYFLDKTQSQDIRSRNNNDDWKSKRAYIGGWVSGGPLYGGNVISGIFGAKVEVSFARYFSLDFDLGLHIPINKKIDLDPAIAPYVNILAHIPFRTESGLDIGILGGAYAGYPSYFGGCVGASLGYNMGPGIIFLDATYLQSFVNTDNNGFIAKLGYKAGLGKR